MSFGGKTEESAEFLLTLLFRGVIIETVKSEATLNGLCDSE